MEQNASCSSKRYSEDEKRSPKKLKTEKTYSEREELCFYNLFNSVLDYIRELKKSETPDNVIADGISSIIQSFRYDLGNKFSDINLSETDKLCGYLFRYASHGAGLVRNRVLHAFNNCTVLKETLKQPELNIVSLGGGPGNDIVGLCSALYEKHCRSRLNITVVDSVQRWSSCLNLVEFYIRESYFGNISELFRQNSVTVSFIMATLPGNPDLDLKYFRTLKEADIIVISRLFASMTWREMYAFSESLYVDVKPETLLLFVDSPFHPELWIKFDILYTSDCGDYFVSEAVSILTRFNHSVVKKSTPEITVLRKKSIMSKHDD